MLCKHCATCHVFLPTPVKTRSRSHARGEGLQPNQTECSGEHRQGVNPVPPTHHASSVSCEAEIHACEVNCGSVKASGYLGMPGEVTGLGEAASASGEGQAAVDRGGGMGRPRRDCPAKPSQTPVQ